jgi:hypothetical protein
MLDLIAGLHARRDARGRAAGPVHSGPIFKSCAGSATTRSTTSGDDRAVAAHRAG